MPCGLFAFAVGAAPITVCVQIVNAQASKPSAIACGKFARHYADNASRQGQVPGSGAVGSLAGCDVRG